MEPFIERGCARAFWTARGGGWKRSVRRMCSCARGTSRACRERKGGGKVRNVGTGWKGGQAGRGAVRKHLERPAEGLEGEYEDIKL